MTDKRRRSFRLIVAALLIAYVSFIAGVFGTLHYLSTPTERSRAWERTVAGKMVSKALINGFHNIWYNGQVWRDTRWLGTPLPNYPTDLIVYQEVIFDVKPDVVLDIGTYRGGSAFFFATILDLVGNSSARVVSVDIEQFGELPRHPRIKYLLGSSTSEAILKQIKELIRPHDKVLVFLDSDHHMQHVLNELRAYSQIVTEGSYIVVEDSNINGHPVYPGFGPGPMGAIHAFLEQNSGFKPSKSREKYLLTVGPDGFLLKR